MVNILLVGYSLYQRGEPKQLVWEEKAPVSVARYAYDGVEVLDGKIYFVGGIEWTSVKNIVERYDPTTNTWETLNSMSVARSGGASAVLNGKVLCDWGQIQQVLKYSIHLLMVITGNNSLTSAKSSSIDEIAITINGKIYLIGGRNKHSDQN